MRMCIFFYLLLTLLFTVGADSIKNPDKPIKGEWQFSPRKVWETDSAADEIMVEIRCIRLDQEGNVFVLDGRRNRIHVFDSLGKHRFSFAKKGEGPGEIKESYNIYLYKNLIIVSDMNKIHYFSKSGDYQKSLNVPEMFIDYVFFNQTQVIGIPLSSVRLRDRMQKRDVYLYNLKASKKKKIFKVPIVQALRYAKGRTRLILKMPAGVAEDLVITSNSKGVFYGYGDHLSFHHLDHFGKEINVISIEGRQRKKITKEEKIIVMKKVLQNFKDLPKNILTEMADQIPDKMPCFNHIHVNQDGLVFLLSDSIREANKKEVDIFSIKGRYLYRSYFKIDDNFSYLEHAIRGSDLVGFVEDEEGERKLVKYSINIPPQN